MKLKLAVCALALAGCIAPQALAVAGVSSLPEAVEQAVLRNPEVLARWHQFRSATEETSAAKGGYLPRVDASAYTGREWRDYPTSNINFNQPGVQVQLRQMLFDGFATSSAVRRANFAQQTRYYELMATTDGIALEATRAYLDVLRYRQFVVLARENWAIHKEIFDQIAERVQAGVGRRVDLEQASGRLALAESNWLTEASNLHDVSARFERLVGQQPPAQLAEMPKLLDKLPKDSDTLPLALKQNPSFLAAVSGLRSARASLDGQKSAHYPTLELLASQSRTRNQDGVSGNYNRGLVQLQLNYNLFRGGSDLARVRSASEQLSAAFDLRDKSCRDIRQETRIAHNDVRRLAEQIRYLNQHQLSTEKARDAYRKQFDIGQRTLLDLLDTENELFQAKRTLAGAELDHQLAQVRVLAQTNLLLPALKLRSVEAQSPDPDSAGAEVEDARIACGSDAAPMIALDRDAAMAARPPRVAAESAPAPAPVPAPVMPPAAPAKPQPSATVVESSDKPVNDLLKGWAEAWAFKKYDAYLSFYASKFAPAKGLSQPVWKSLRKDRLAKNDEVIQLKLDQVVVKSTGADTAAVSFAQSYSADGFVDEVEKTLDLVREGGQWKILRERVTKGRTF